MGFQPTSPVDVDHEVTSTQTVTLNRYEIQRLDIILADPASPIGHVYWAKGYDDAGDFVPVQSFKTVFSGASFQAHLSALADNSKSVYDNVRDRTWTLLEEMGEIDTGTVV